MLVVLIACPWWLMMLNIFEVLLIIHILSLWSISAIFWPILYLVVCFLIIFMLLTHMWKEAWENGLGKGSKACIWLLHKKDSLRDFKLSLGTDFKCNSTVIREQTLYDFNTFIPLSFCTLFYVLGYVPVSVSL